MVIPPYNCQMLEVLTHRRLSDRVVDRIVDAVRGGSYAPGDRLPSERDLGESLGVSRVSVREALRILELLEVVEVRHGRGAFVVSREVRPTGRLLRHWLLAHREEVLELLEVREALEATAAEAAAERRTSLRIAEVPEGAEVDRLTSVDVDFHQQIATASGNLVLASLIQELNGVLEESRYAMFSLPQRPHTSALEHQQIAAAIGRGDKELARSAMRAHIRSVREEIRDLDAKGGDV